ncbi:helix-turn-helix domain-containing protein [Herbiconiux sp. CPCC 205716]|uniref:Helix-turn-helix domain-containing protein n=1 Tax=Herbiconiux gentiana TaxID=2970912 RepID=A0ABT2GD80_9MICO|nr:helix-turn-helix domain-containing protein [Herbiconiux gentiana]MCS5714179.1 helix-turn-helix domain-containing protein [Herbiconiux gentiana]
MSQDTISGLLRNLRQSASLTLEELSERSGVSVRGISDIERGVSAAPRRSTLAALAAGLDLDGDDSESLLVAARRARTVDSDLPSALRPSRLNDFTGRERELTELDAMLAVASPVVVITGPGGFGKTTLAIECTSHHAPAEGLVFVDLAGQGRPPLSPLEVVQSVLRQTDEDLADPPTSLTEAVARWEVVARLRQPTVLLDNVASEDQVRPILSALVRGPIILTSRRTVAGITATGRLTLDSLEPPMSVKLLGRIIPESQRGPTDLQELAALCNGVPLALRIAGNRVASRPATSVRDYVDRMQSEERRLGLLVAGDLSVETVLAVSYDELDAGTAALFRASSIIDGLTFDSRIAAAASGQSHSDAEMRLESLVDLGIIESRGDNRYRMHDLLRVFAASRLRLESSADEVASAQDRLMYWLLRTLLVVVGDKSVEVPIPEEWEIFRLDDDPEGADERTARAWVLAEADHWWPAVRRAASVGDHDAVLRVAASLQWRSAKWHEWGRWHELNELALRSATALGDKRLQSLRSSLLAWTAMTELGNPILAQQSALTALEIAESIDDAYASSRARYFYAWASLYAGQTEGLEEHLTLAIDGYEETGAFSEARQARTIRGVLYRRLGQHERAVSELTAVLNELPAAFTEDGEDFATSFSRNVVLEELANSYVEVGDPESALRMADALVSMISTLDMDVFTARSRIIRARALLAGSRTDESLDELEKVGRVLAEYPPNGHVAMMLVEAEALHSAATGGGAVPGAIADLRAENRTDDASG